MRCPVCGAMAGQGECAECRGLDQELRANAEALSALRDEELPPLAVRISRRSPVYSWAGGAAAAVLLVVALTWQTSPRPAPAARAQPLTIKMLTPDPDVVIYWLIDAKEGE
jgi:hypothetical protein